MKFHLETHQCWGPACRHPWRQRPLRIGQLCAWPENESELPKHQVKLSPWTESRHCLLLVRRGTEPRQFPHHNVPIPRLMQGLFQPGLCKLNKFNGEIHKSSHVNSHQPCPSAAFSGRKSVEIAMLQYRVFSVKLSYWKRYVQGVTILHMNLSSSDS